MPSPDLAPLLRHGVEAVSAGSVVPLPDELAEVVDAIDLGAIGVRIVDRRVGAVAQQEPVPYAVGQVIPSHDLAGGVDAYRLGVSRFRIVDGGEVAAAQQV